MTKINFKRLELFDLSGKQCVVIDAKEQIAQLIYNNSYGVVGHMAAHKIYESDGEVELSTQEVEALEPVVVKNCAPPVIDAIFKQLGLDSKMTVGKYNKEGE